MGGYKTWVAGLGLIATGAGMVLSAILPALGGDLVGVDWATVQSGIAMAGAGLAAIGIGHKVEKIGKK